MASQHQILMDEKARKHEMSEQWLVCTFVKGMFSDELAVIYRDLSFFISKQFVEQGVSESAKVRVRVFKESGKTWAVLPTEDRATIAVDQGDLVPA